MISGIHIKNFKSIGEDAQSLNNLGKINVLIGGNNSGKTAVLELMWIFGELILDIDKGLINSVPSMFQAGGIKFSADNVFNRIRQISPNVHDLTDFVNQKKAAFQFGLSYKIDRKLIESTRNKYNESSNERITKKIQKNIGDLDDLTVWFEVDVTKSTIRINNLVWGKMDLMQDDLLLDLHNYLATDNEALNYNHNDVGRAPYTDVFVPEIVKIINSAKCYFIHSKRKIKEIVTTDDGDANIKGELLKKDLFELFHGEKEHRSKYFRVLEIFHDVTGKKIRDVPYIQKGTKKLDVVFEEKGTLVNIDNAGYGYYQLLSLIYNVVMNNADIILIDEPEISLYPQAQVQLFSAIEKIFVKENKQFIMATHSPYFVDLNNISNIYKVSKPAESQAVISHITNSAVIKSIKKKGEGIFHFRHRELFFMDKVIFVEGVNDLDRFSRIIDGKEDLGLSKEYLYQLTGGLSNRVPLFNDFCNDLNIKRVFIVDFDVILQNTEKENEFLEILDGIKKKNVSANELIQLSQLSKQDGKMDKIKKFWISKWKNIWEEQKVKEFIYEYTERNVFIMPFMDVKQIDDEESFLPAVDEILRNIATKLND